MKIAIRLDDIAPGMDREKFDRFAGLLDGNGIMPLIGVVPDCRDPKLGVGGYDDRFWEEIRSLRQKGWVIAMHGLTHVYTTDRGGLFPLNRNSEFAGLQYTDQLEMLTKGRDILLSNGITSDIFMAPSHSYDKNTLYALAETGFRYVTDGFGRYPFIRKGLIFLPISVSRGRALKDERPGFTTFVVHTGAMDEQDFIYYEKLFAEHRDRFISYSELIIRRAEEWSATDGQKVRYDSRGLAGNMAEYLTAVLKRTAVSIRSRS